MVLEPVQSKDVAKREIKRLVDLYIKDKDKWQRIKETETRSKFIDPMLKALGWDFDSTDEVQMEESVANESTKKRADYTFRLNGVIRLIVEAKAIKEDLSKKDYIDQAIGYAYNKSCSWAVLTDFQGVKIFFVDEEGTTFRDIILSDINRFDSNFENLWLMSRDSLFNNLIDKIAEDEGRKARKVKIDQQLFQDLNVWRGHLYKDIKANYGSKYKDEEIEEIVQKIIDRLIFIRKIEDLQITEPILKSLLRQNRPNVYKELKVIFKQFNEDYNSKLFGESEKDEHEADKIDVGNKATSQVIEGMYKPSGRTVEYNFAVIDADILGNIYERYLGYILKKHKIVEGHAHRKEQGIYYTPTYIVDYIVRNTLGEILKDKKINPEKLHILDPACGSGSFLIKSFDYLNSYWKTKEGKQTQTKLDLENGVTFTRKTQIVKDNIFGADLDPKAVEIAQLNLLLKLAEKKHRLPTLRNNIKIGNSLIEDSKISSKNFVWDKEFPEIMKELGFDVIVGNPPYVRIQTLDKKQVEFFNKTYESATKNYDIYALFVERSLKLLKPNGILGFILPTKFFTADYGEGLRKIIAKNKCLYKIVDFKDFQVFDGATTYTCLLFLRKKENKTFEYATLMNGNKLKSSKVLKDNMLEKSEIDQPKGSEPWQFVSSKDEKVFEKLNSIKLKLEDISDNIYQGIITGCDKVYILIKKGDEFYSPQTKKNYKLENELIHPLLKGSRHIRRYRTEASEKYVIFPYRIVNAKAVPISETEMEKKYPKLYHYLLENKSLLEKRDGGKMKGKNWYLFSRNQNLTRFGQEKLMTPSIAKEPSFTFDSKSDFFFVGSGGGGGGAYGITLKEKGLYLYVLGILNSRIVSFFIKNTSSKFSGGFFAFNRQYIENIPIIISYNVTKAKVEELVKKQMKNYASLNEIGDLKIDKRADLEKEIENVDKSLNEIFYKIYGITESERKIIEDVR
jgi:type I restriction-modification system DNA methylase subunit